MFELSSAYGTVGLTLSPYTESLTAYLSPFSMIVMMLVMLAGRHRGIPFDTDTALQGLTHWGTPLASGLGLGSSAGGRLGSPSGKMMRVRSPERARSPGRVEGGAAVVEVGEGRS